MNKFEMRKAIKNAIIEDIGIEDISSAPLKEKKVKLFLIAKQDGVLAGIDVFIETFMLLDKETKIKKIKRNCKDGVKIKKGDKLLEISGKAHKVLQAERVALNFLGRMSGIATKTNEIVKLLKGTKIRLADTRKTAPNLRMFDKYSVKVGGGVNHRFNLSDAVMLKDNHIKAAGSIKNAVSLTKKNSSFAHKIEVETENMKMVREAVKENVDIIMLDNMKYKELKEATQYIKKINKNIIVEVSGNATKEKVKEIKDLQIDIISSGEITHSVKNFDFSLK